VPLAELNTWTWWAMIATEDGAFYKHRGLRPGLLLRALKLDLDYGRFVYGGSTITQQLVKNIFLTRAKNLSRKFEELLIVWHIERELPNLIVAKNPKDPPNKAAKDRILEMYVNMIEFGSNGKPVADKDAVRIYGIDRAAKTYFDKDPRALTPLESAFLAANKPCPRCGYARFAGKKWDDWWQARMAGIMEKMRKEKVITEEQYLAEMPFVPKFVGWPQTIAPAAEAPAAGVEE
jgi:penicillin-binding protein 1A